MLSAQTPVSNNNNNNLLKHLSASTLCGILLTAQHAPPHSQPMPRIDELKEVNVIQ